MNENLNSSDLARELKQHLEDNEGDIVYWGEKMAIPNKVSLEKILSKPTHPSSELDRLRDQTIGDCHLCPLGDTRKKIVFGVGNPEADVMFVGEGPGFDEDRQGEPFVGKAGQLLDKIMAAIGLSRKEIYIANIVKCHPMVDPSKSESRGNDRPPSVEEIEKCIPFLKEQILIVKPSFIVTLGATATKAILQKKEGISSLRGHFYDLNWDGFPSIQVLPTFHPAALLRDETYKRPVWEDMKLLREALTRSEKKLGTGSQGDRFHFAENKE